MNCNQLYKIYDHYFEKSDSTTIPVYIDRRSYLNNKPIYQKFDAKSILLELKPKRYSNDFLLYKYVLFNGIKFYIHKIHIYEI